MPKPNKYEALNQYRQTRPAHECGLGFAQDRLWKDFDSQTMLRWNPRLKVWMIWYLAPRSGPYCIHSFDRSERSSDLINSKSAHILRKREAASNHLKEMMELARQSETEKNQRTKDLQREIADFSDKNAKGTTMAVV